MPLPWEVFCSWKLHVKCKGRWAFFKIGLCTVRALSELVLRQYVLVLCMLVITFSKSKNQLGKVANPARGQLNWENEYFPVPVRA